MNRNTYTFQIQDGIGTTGVVLAHNDAEAHELICRHYTAHQPQTPPQMPEYTLEAESPEASVFFCEPGNIYRE